MRIAKKALQPMEKHLNAGHAVLPEIGLEDQVSIGKSVIAITASRRQMRGKGSLG
jgi:hypothetical protein